LALALLALIPPIIALYLLKLRRQEHQVSSVYLWQRFVRDVEANAPWQRLRRNWLLLLQVLLLLTLILALSRPATEAEGVTGQTVVFILDQSASMAALEADGQSRLAAAKAVAHDLITHLPEQTEVTLIAAAGGEANLLVSASRDRPQILAALVAAQATALNSDLGPAVALAEAIVAREPEAQVVLLSDGGVQLPAQIAAPLRFIPIGETAHNQAISLLTVSPPTLFVQVANYSPQPARRRLVIAVDGVPFTAYDLDLPPGGHAGQLLEDLPPTAHTIHASLTPADALPLDDEAWGVLGSQEAAQVTLVTRGNFFLQTALNLLQEQRHSLELTVVSPENWLPEAASPEALYIFDRYLPPQLPPGSLLLIAPPGPAAGLFGVAGEAANPIPQPLLPDHSLLHHVNLAETQILSAAVVTPGDWGQVIVAGSPETPLLVAGEVEGRRVAILAFDLHQSDLPLRPAFPILVANLVNYLSPGASSLAPPTAAPGQALTLSAPPGMSQLRLVAPDGTEATFAVAEGRITLPPFAQPGLYHLAFEPDGPAGMLAVNFADPLESAITPKALPDLSAGGAAPSLAASAPAYREWWWPLALAALALLVAEWLLYRRGALAQLWDRLRSFESLKSMLK
jgi:hypothetical protein